MVALHVALQEKCEKHDWNLEKASEDFGLWLEASEAEDEMAALEEWYEETLNQEGEEAFK